MSSNKKSSLKEPTKSKPKPGVGSRKAHHAMEQQSISNFLIRPSATPQSSSDRGSRDRSSFAGASGSSSSKGRSVAPSTGPGGKRSVVSAVKERDRGGGAGGSSGGLSPSLSRSTGPSSLASGSKNTSSSDGKRKRDVGSSGLDAKGKGKAREIIELDDSDDDTVKKEENDASDLEEIYEPPLKKRQRLSALPLPTSKKAPAASRHRSSSSPTNSSPPPSTTILALPPEKKKSHRRRYDLRPSPPAAASHYPSSPPPRDLSPSRDPHDRSAFRSSPPQLSASLAPYLPANHPSPTSLYRPTSTQEVEEANLLTGLKDDNAGHLKQLRRPRPDWETDAAFAERKEQLRVLEGELALKSVNNSMRPMMRGLSGVGGERYVQAQRRAAEEQREVERRGKERKEQQREERERERQAKKMRTAEPRSERQDAPPFVPSLAGPSRNVHQREEAPNSTPTISSSRRHPASRPRHNPPPFSLASTPIQQQERLASPPMLPPSRRRPAPPSPPLEELFSLTESQFPPLADPPPRPANESPPPSPSPPPAPIPAPIPQNRLPLPPPRPQFQHPPSDDVGESQWSAHDYYNPNPPRNPFVDHPIPLSDLLPINPTIAGMEIPDPEEYETQLGMDGIPESQYGESAAGWSAFEAVHVHRPERIFEEDPSRSIGEGNKVEGGRNAGEVTPKEVASDGHSSATENPPQQDSSQTQPFSSQSQIGSALHQPASLDVSASRVLVEATPSPTSGRSSSPPRNALLPPRSSVNKARPPLQPIQLTLLHQREPSSPSQDPSSGESIAFLDRSPGSIPVRDFTVAKDDSSSGPGSSGIDELEDQEMTPRGKEARKAMLEELEGEGFKELEVRAEVTPTSRNLAELFNGSNMVPRVGSRSQDQRSPVVSRTGSLMGPPAPPSPTSPRKAPASPSKATNTSPLKGSPLRPPSLRSPFQAGPSHHQPQTPEEDDDDDDDEIVPETQSDSPAARPFIDIKSLNPKRPLPFEPVLSPVVASGSVASSSKPRQSEVSGFSGSAFAGLHPEDDELNDAPSASASTTNARSKPPPSKSTSETLTTSKLTTFGFTLTRDQRPLDRGARSEDEDVSASDDDDVGGSGAAPPSVNEGKGKEKEKSSPYGLGGKVLQRVPSPPPLSVVKPAPLRRHNALRPPISYSPQFLDSQSSFPPKQSLPASLNHFVLAEQEDDASDTESHVSSSQTQFLTSFPRRGVAQEHDVAAGPSVLSSLGRRRVDPGALQADNDDDDDRVPSSQADDVAGPSSFAPRSGLVEEKDDQGYETDDSERVPASDASPSPLSFRTVKIREAVRRQQRAPSPPSDDGERNDDEEEEEGDRTIVQADIPPSLHTQVGSSSSASSSSGQGVGTLVAEKWGRLQDLLLSSSSSEQGSGFSS